MTTFVIPVPSGTVLQKEIESEAREKKPLIKLLAFGLH